MTWEAFAKQGVLTLPPMTVSIFNSGLLNVSAIHEQLGDEVELKYHTSGLLGLLPVPERTPISHRVSKNTKQNTWAISLIAYISHYELPHIKGKRFSVTKDGDLFIIDLNNPIGEIIKRKL